MNLKRIAMFFTVCCMVLTSPSFNAMASSDANNTLQVMISIDQKLTFEGKPVKPEDLPGKLKSAGAKPHSIIRILVQKNTPEVMLKTISRELANAGYRKFVFTQPKQAESTVKTPSRK